ncbi:MULTISPECIES: KPN_02809 family neutral zinc metallopeptidase [unclassified Nocardioides]|uniref:KPN_02809 family neutral zinc metallopeptidase n=1 Tax=unclassified Nocardioides TaxID=2615069 RepID=UPI000AFFE779|nr:MULTISPECIES: neutral zinc metallopeptidase [unclassified Nocardioides]
MVRFNPKARLDQSRVRDAGSGGGGGGLGGGGLGGGGMRLPIPTGRGGIGTLVILVILFLVARCAGVDLGLGGAAQVYSPTRLSDAQEGGDRYADCKTGEDANNSQDCARVAIENSLTDYWDSELGGKFRPEEAMVTFSGSVDTGCGAATSNVGPFYCPSDESIYLDTTFFDDVLEGQLGGPDGSFVEFYVLAHEYGHHISNLLGFMGQVKGGTGPQSDGVRLELQADCYAGLWANHATKTEDASGEVLILDLTQQDIDEAIAAAKAVGDDYIQKRSGGRVNEEAWTHGSSEQRKKWFMVGYEQGSLDACDTFSADRV